MRTVYKNLCPAKISASIMAANMWKNSLKNVESDKNKILYETFLNFFSQRMFCRTLRYRNTLFGKDRSKGSLIFYHLKGWEEGKVHKIIATGKGFLVL